jgi:hypothetical protein
VNIDIEQIRQSRIQQTRTRDRKAIVQLAPFATCVVVVATMTEPLSERSIFLIIIVSWTPSLLFMRVFPMRGDLTGVETTEHGASIDTLSPQSSKAVKNDSVKLDLG